MKPLDQVDHRPWPVPARPWIMKQTWHNLLFAHWPVPAEAIRPLLHEGLQLDTFDGDAWIGIIPFRLSGIQLRWLPPVPFVETFTEINVRTYVKFQGKPGILFLSLDTDNPLVTAFARPWFHMPYHNADMQFRVSGEKVIFCSKRRARGAERPGFCAVYEPGANLAAAQAGTLEHWLTERYCFYCRNTVGNLFRCEAHHPRWRLREAQADVIENTMTAPYGIDLGDRKPLLHYSHRMDALIWPVEKLERDRARQFTVPYAKASV
jgi:uncharacterized protein